MMQRNLSASKFVHQYTGDWCRIKDGQPFRAPAVIEEFNSLREIKDPVTRMQFRWMLYNKTLVTSVGSHVYQIRD